MANPLAIQEAIFKAVDAILEKRLQSLNLNYCMIGIVDAVLSDHKTGEPYYIVDFQGTKVQAYAIDEKKAETVTDDGFVRSITDTLEIHSSNGEVIDVLAGRDSGTRKYKVGDSVYTLVINGDMSKRRLILSKT